MTMNDDKWFQTDPFEMPTQVVSSGPETSAGRPYRYPWHSVLITLSKETYIKLQEASKGLDEPLHILVREIVEDFMAGTANPSDDT